MQDYAGRGNTSRQEYKLLLLYHITPPPPPISPLLLLILLLLLLLIPFPCLLPCGTDDEVVVVFAGQPPLRQVEGQVGLVLQQGGQAGGGHHLGEGVSWANRRETSSLKTNVICAYKEGTGLPDNCQLWRHSRNRFLKRTS